MDLVKKIAMLVCTSMAFASPQDFKLSIGPAVASGDFVFKAAALAVRAEGCAEPDKPEVTATAEGTVNGVRKSVALKVAAASKGNVFAIFPGWGDEGTWVVNLTGACGKATAGAIVPFAQKNFIRDAAKFYPRAATDKEVEAVLKGVHP